MKHITANVARQDFDGVLSSVIQYGDVVSIATDMGSAILVSAEEWSGLQETLYLQSIPNMMESIVEGVNTPINECVPASEVWSDV